MCECVYVCVLYDMILILLLILILILLILLQLLQLLQLLLLQVRLVFTLLQNINEFDLYFRKILLKQVEKILNEEMKVCGALCIVSYCIVSCY